jgi:NAD(P)H-hydrate epimerase
LSSGRTVPSLSSAQVREVDRISSERYGLPVDWLMEAAGWQVARHCPGRTVLVCGTGNNGGDALAAARHLHRWGRLVRVCCIDPSRLRELPSREAAALRAAGIDIEVDLDLGGAELVLDGLLGTGLDRPPTGRYAEWIGAILDSRMRVVAIDVPSGLDSDSGRPLGQSIRADLTVTLGLPKKGLLTPEGRRHSGEVWVADIGIPPQVYAELGIEVPEDLFSTQDRVPLADLTA